MLLFLLVLGGGIGTNAQTTVTQTSFTATSGNVGGDKNVSYKAEKGKASTAPAINNGQIRVYQNGGLFTVSVADGYTLTNVTLGSAMATTVTYVTDKSTTASATQSIAKNGTLSVDFTGGEKSITYTCTGATKNDRLYVNSLSVTYTSESTGKTKTTLAFADPADKTFDLNATEGTDFTNAATLTPSVEGASITYASDNEDIAVVGENGEVLVETSKVGKATITASYAGNDTYDAATASYTIEVVDPNKPRWIKTELSALTPTDQFVIVDLNSKKAMTNDGGSTSLPAAVDVTLSEDGTELTGDIADNIKWNVTNTNGSYTFYPNGKTDSWLYTGTSNSKSLYVGTGEAKNFTEATNTNKYKGLKDGTNNRYVGVNSGKDWRSYTSINSTISSTSMAYFKSYAAGEKVKTATSLSFADGDKAFYQGNTEGLTFTNTATLTPAIEGATITYASSNESIATVDANGQVTVNTENEGTAIITASFEGNDDYAPSSASYNISVEKVYQNIAALKDAYTKSSFDGALRLNNAQVTYVDGRNHYLQDESGAVDVYCTFDYEAGDVLNGIATVTYKPYNGLPEITSFKAVGEITKTSGEAPSPTEMTIAEANDDANLCKYVVLKKVTITPGNAGNATASDGTENTINVYEKEKTFVEGSYDLTGIVSCFKNKQIAFISYAPDFDIDETATENALTAGEGATVTVKRTFNDNAWNTLVLPFDLTAEQIANAFGSEAKVASYTGATANADNSYALNFTVATTITANVPVFIYGAQNNADGYTFTGVEVKDATPTQTAEGFNFEGTYVKTTVPVGNFFVNSQNKLYKAGDDQTSIKGTRATFAPVGEATAAKGLGFNITEDGTTTAINAVTMQEEANGNEPMYNLAGQRVSKAYKGVVIQNGKKYILK